MTRVVKIAVLMGVAAFAVGASAAAFAAPGDQSTPSGWSYEIKDGKRVPKANRVTNADGAGAKRSGRAAASRSRK